jgi:protein tyrosine/serine phosphatase
LPAGGIKGLAAGVPDLGLAADWPFAAGWAIPPIMASAHAQRPISGRAAWLNSLFVDHALLRLGWRNWGVVESGRLYRSNHPLPWQLREAVHRHGLRTVINLRGYRQDCGSDVLGRREAAMLGLAYIDAPFESRGAPHKDRILRLAGIYRDMAEPALLHCKSGADRAGLAAGLWLLLQGRPVEQAQAQLSLRYGHIRQGKTGVLDAFFELYAQAAPKPFLDWLKEDYDEEGLRRRFRSKPWADALVDKVLRRE